MYKQEFEKLLSNNKLFNSYLFYGECNYLIEYYTKTLSKKHSISNDDIIKIYFNDYKFSYAKEVLSQLGLFGGNNVLVIKTDKALPKKEVDYLINLCNKIDNSFLIICGYADKTFSNIAKSFTQKNNAVAIRLFEPYSNEIVSILKQEAINYNLNIDIPTLMHLYNKHKQNLTNSVNDLQKLSVFNDKITNSLIDLYCFENNKLNIEDFIFNLLYAKDIRDELSIIQEENIEIISIINQISSTLTELFRFNSFIKLNGFIDSKAILGYKLPKYIENRRAKLSIKLTQEQYNNIFDILFECELKLKTDTKIDKMSLFISTMLSINQLVI